MIATREPTPNERRFMVLAAARLHPGARPAGILLLLFAVAATAWVIAALVAGRGPPWRLVVVVVVVALLLGAELLLLSLGPSGEGAAVVTYTGAYRTTRERVGARQRVVHWIGEARVQLPPGWQGRLQPGKTVQAELGILTAALGHHPQFRRGGVWLLSLGARHRVEREVDRGLLEVRFPVSLVAAALTLVGALASTAAVIRADPVGGAPWEAIASGLADAVALGRWASPATAAAALWGLTALLLVRGAWVMLRNGIVLRRIAADAGLR